MRRLLAAAGAMAFAGSVSRVSLAAVGVEFAVPPGSAPLSGVMACTSVGLGPGWCKSADFQDLAKRLGVGVMEVTGANEFGAYPMRCTDGEFKQLLDAIAAAGAAQGHPELANAPIIGMGHSHGGDYWNYFNACYPERMAIVFDKSSGGVQYVGEALKTPQIWEVGTNDLKDSAGDFRGQSFAHRSKGSPMALVLGPGETHGQLGAAPRAMVIALIEAIFPLRVPAGADFRAGPVRLYDIDETTGCYWVGDNYTKEESPYAMSPDTGALFKTSFLPSAAIATMWKGVSAALPTSMVIDDGVCGHCYANPPGEPPATVGPTAPGCGGSDAGVAPPGGDDDAAPGDAEPGDATTDASEESGTDVDAGAAPPGVDAGGAPAPGSKADAGAAGSGAPGAGAPEGPSSPSPESAGPGATAGCSCETSGRMSSHGMPAGFAAIGVLALGRRLARNPRRPKQRAKQRNVSEVV